MAFDFFGNPAEDADKFYKQIPGQISQYYDPYINAGRNQLAATSGQYGQLMNDPSARLNQIGAGYKQSPGFQFALQQALQGAGHAAAAGGMAGSLQHQQESMGLASNLASQDYDKWLSHALGLYGKGLEGGQHQADQGYNAGNEYAQNIAQNTQNRGNLAYQATQQRNKNFSDVLGAGAGALAAFYGMPSFGGFSGLFGGEEPQPGQTAGMRFS